MNPTFYGLLKQGAIPLGQEDFDSYSDAIAIVGSSVLVGGTGFTGAGDVLAEESPTALETFDEYSDASNITPSSVLIAGIAFSGAGDVLGYASVSALESFDTYADVTGVTPSTLTDGYGFTGAPDVLA